MLLETNNRSYLNFLFTLFFDTLFSFCLFDLFFFNLTFLSVYQLHFRTCEGYIYFGRRGAIGDPVLGGSPGGGKRGVPGGGGGGGGAGGAGGARGVY